MRQLIGILLCWCVIFIVSAKSDVCQQQRCIAVVDAGSTGSRLHIYSYDLDSNNNPIQINEQWSNKIKPGIATIDPSQLAVKTYLNHLFEGSPKLSIPLYFYATAGMRLVPEAKQRLYFQFLQQWFSLQSQWQLMDAKTITGSEEGMLGWLAVNYKVGHFSSDKPLVNVIDVGGASVQVTLPVQDSEQIDKQDLFDVDVYGRHYVLFAHSFLGLGQNVFLQQFLNVDNCFSNGYPLPNGRLGKGDASSCQQAVSMVMDQMHEVSRIVKSAITSNGNHSWYAIGGVASLLESNPISFQNKQFTNQQLLEKVDTEACKRPWQDLNAENPNNEYVYGTCLFASYYYALMVDGYGIKPEELVSYMPSNQGLDWSLGVVLHQQI